MGGFKWLQLLLLIFWESGLFSCTYWLSFISFLKRSLLHQTLWLTQGVNPCAAQLFFLVTYLRQPPAEEQILSAVQPAAGVRSAQVQPEGNHSLLLFCIFRNKWKSSNMWRLLARTFFAVGCKQFCFLYSCEWIIKPTIITSSDYSFCAIKSEYSKCREALTIWIFSALLFEQTWEHLYVICSFFCSPTVDFPSAPLFSAWQRNCYSGCHEEGDSPCCFLCVCGDNWCASIFAFPGFCWMAWCSWARNKVVLVTAG